MSTLSRGKYLVHQLTCQGGEGAGRLWEFCAGCHRNRKVASRLERTLTICWNLASGIIKHRIVCRPTLVGVRHNQGIEFLVRAILICVLVCLGLAHMAASRAYGSAERASTSDSGKSSNGDEANSDEPKNKSDAKLHIGGALRFNAFYKSWDEANHDRKGDFNFDTFRINADGSFEGIDVSLEYRFYAGFNMLHHGYVGHTFENGTDLQIGVSRTPFGVLPYASHNWFFDITYYLGMEDDYDAGIKIVRPSGRFDIQLAFYKNDEGSFTGQSIDAARYSYDVVHSDSTEIAGLKGGPRTDEEINQFNGRVAFTALSTEIGVSGEYGGLYNSTTRKTGDHWAAAVHLNGNYGRFNVMLEALSFAFEPDNPSGQDDRFVVMGAYDAPYKVAAEGEIFLANVAYKLPVGHELLNSITFYNNYSYLKKKDSSFADSEMNVLGMLLAAGRLFTYVDFAFGKNQPWIGSNYQSALAEGDPDADWELRFNINIGYYY